MEIGIVKIVRINDCRGKTSNELTIYRALHEFFKLTQVGILRNGKIIDRTPCKIHGCSFLFAESYESYGWLSRDGLGRRSFFDSNGNFAHPIPAIRLDGNIEFEIVDNYKLFNIQVYDLDHNDIGDLIDSFNDLPNGSYYVIIKATRVGDFIESENKHEETTNEYIFGIVVE